MTAPSTPKKRQMSDSVFIGLLTAFSGGYMDAYTYLFRDGVFANAQTGNIILFGVNLTSGNNSTAFEHLFPVLAFTSGVFIAQLIRLHFKNYRHFHWRQASLLIEVVIMIAVSLMSITYNLPANCLVSFACGIQVQTIQKIHGNSIATTMCIGNLRTATHAFCDYFHTKNHEFLGKSLFYYGAISVFMLGAVAGKFFLGLWGQYSILLSAVLLFVAFCAMFIEEKEAGIPFLK